MRFSRKATLPRVYLGNVITLTSLSGVGGSSVFKALKEMHQGQVWMKFISGSEIMGQLAENLNMSKIELVKYIRDNPDCGLDAICDQVIARKSRVNNTITETRLPHLVPHAFHVLHTCPTRIRAERRKKDRGFENQSVEEVLKDIEARDLLDRERYEMLYPGCVWPEEDYDLVLSTEVTPPASLARKILEAQTKWKLRLMARGTQVLVDL